MFAKEVSRQLATVVPQFGKHSKFDEIRRARERAGPLSFSYLACWVVESSVFLSFPHLTTVHSPSETNFGKRETHSQPIARTSQTFSRDEGKKLLLPWRIPFLSSDDAIRPIFLLRENREKRPYSSRLGRDWQWERAIGAFTSRDDLLRSSHTVSLRRLSHDDRRLKQPNNLDLR